MLLAALLLIPTGLAEDDGDRVRAEFSFGDARLSGQLAFPAQNLTALLFPPADGDERFRWTLAAERVVLNWTNSTRIEVADPGNPSDAYASLEKGPPDYAEDAFPDATATSGSRSPDSNLLVRPLDGAPVIVEVVLDASLRLPATLTTMHAGSNAAATASYPAENTTMVRYDPPPDHMEARPAGAAYTIRGNLSIAVWDAALALASQGQRTTYEGGTSVRGVYPSPLGPGMLRERDYRLMTLHATNAVLEVEGPAAGAVLALPRVVLDGPANATFSQTAGVLQVGVAAPTVLPDELVVDADLHVEAWRPFSASDRLAAVMTCHALAGLEDGEGTSLLADAAPGEEARFRGMAPLAWIAGSSGLALAGGLAVHRRNRPVRIEDVEWALLTRDARRSQHLARRLVRQRPSDPDAIFLYGSALLGRGLTARVLRDLEPLARNVAAAHRAGIAYILAVAARAQGNPSLARRWAAEAAAEPVLRTQLLRQNMGDLLRRRKGASAGTAQQSGYS